MLNRERTLADLSRPLQNLHRGFESRTRLHVFVYGFGRDCVGCGRDYHHWYLSEGKSRAQIGRGPNGYPSAVLELLSLIIGTTRSAVSGRNDLILENLLLRHQLHVALRPRRRLSLQPRDRLFWVLVRRVLPDWRRYLLFVRPEAVIRWHRRGRRWFWQWRWRTRLGVLDYRPKDAPSSRGWPARTHCGEPSGFEASCSSSASSLVPDRSGAIGGRRRSCKP